MILVDANLLLYAEDTLSEHHQAARIWWDTQLSGAEPVCLCWPVLTAFIRVGTNLRLHRRPLSLKEAVERVQSWLDQPCVRMIKASSTGRFFKQCFETGKLSAVLYRTRTSLLWRLSTTAFYKARTRISHGS